MNVMANTNRDYVEKLCEEKGSGGWGKKPLIARKRLFCKFKTQRIERRGGMAGGKKNFYPHQTKAKGRT